MHVRVDSFGRWGISIQGEEAPALRSRYARELLVRLSTSAEPVGREHLIAELRPSEPDLGRARRRLTQELSRIQQVVGPIWASTREVVQVASGCELGSDLATFLHGAKPDARPTDPDEERAHLAALVDLPRRGELLVGHQSEWVLGVRADVERTEARLLARLLSWEGGDEQAMLDHAYRWAELDPFLDEAHAAVVKLLVATRGRDPAAAYVDEIEERYQRELGLQVGNLIRDELTRGVLLPRHSLWVEINALEEQARGVGKGGGENVVRTLFKVDDLLRITGHHRRRDPIHNQLQRLGADPVDLAWRQSELASVTLNPGLAEKYLSGPGDRPLKTTPEQMLAVTRAHLLLERGSIPDAQAALEGILDFTDSVEVGLEARLLMGSLRDRTHDGRGGEATLLEAVDLAQQAELPHYHALALCALGWNRTRSGDLLQAEHHLEEGLELATSAGADLAVAEIHGAVGHLRFQQLRFGSSVREWTTAAELAAKIGHDRFEFRSSSNAIVAAAAIGDLAVMDHHLTRATEAFWQNDLSLCSQLGFMFLYEKSVALACQGDYEGAIAVYRELDEACTAAGLYHGDFRLRTLLEEASLYLSWGRPLESVVAANAALAATTSTGVLGPIATMATGYLGAALVAAGDPAAGIVHLREVTTGNQAGLPVAPTFHYWHHQAAMSLGLKAEAHTAAVRARQLLHLIRSDLTTAQWDNALTNAPGIKRLASIEAES